MRLMGAPGKRSPAGAAASAAAEQEQAVDLGAATRSGLPGKH